MAKKDDLIGVPLEKAARIIGVTRTRLVEWAGRNILVPAGGDQRIGVRRRWIYGLEDLVAGRVVVALEVSGVDIRSITHLMRFYRETHERPLTELRWGVEKVKGKTKVYAHDGLGWMDGRQGVLHDTIDIEEIRTSVRTDVRRRDGRPGEVTRRRGALGYQPIFEGTRVPVSAVQAWIARGAPAARILEAYPMLTGADIERARREMNRAS